MDLYRYCIDSILCIRGTGMLKKISLRKIMAFLACSYGQWLWAAEIMPAGTVNAQAIPLLPESAVSLEIELSIYLLIAATYGFYWWKNRA